MVKYLELIHNIKEKHVFALFCECLDQEYSWISDELRAERKCQKGKLRVEEYINYEAGVLVMKRFGNSKRLSELEKKEIHDMVAMRTQCTKEVWQGQLKKTEETLKTQVDINTDHNAQMEDIIENITTFMELHRQLMLTNKGKFHCKLDLLQVDKTHSADNQADQLLSILEILYGELRRLREQTSIIMDERDNLLKEKSDALQVINIDDKFATLDVEMKKVVDLSQTEIKRGKAEVERRNDKIRSLEHEQDSLRKKMDKTIKDRDADIRFLNAELINSNAKVKDLNEQVDRLTRSLSDTNEDLKEVTFKSGLLEKTRRLGFVQDKEVANKWHAIATIGKIKETKSHGKVVPTTTSDKWRAAAAWAKLSKEPQRPRRPKSCKIKSKSISKSTDS